VQTFGEKKNADSGEKQPGNYMAYRGAQLTFGKLTMKDTDMILIDMDPKDPFDFYLDHYKDQLVAGYTKITPAFGLRVFMRDFHKLRRSPLTKAPMSGSPKMTATSEKLSAGKSWERRSIGEGLGVRLVRFSYRVGIEILADVIGRCIERQASARSGYGQRVAQINCRRPGWAAVDGQA